MTAAPSDPRPVSPNQGQPGDPTSHKPPRDRLLAQEVELRNAEDNAFNKEREHRKHGPQSHSEEHVGRCDGWVGFFQDRNHP